MECINKECPDKFFYEKQFFNSLIYLINNFLMKSNKLLTAELNSIYCNVYESFKETILSNNQLFSCKVYFILLFRRIKYRIDDNKRFY